MKDKIFSDINHFLMRAIDATYKPMRILMFYIPWEGTRIKQVIQNSEKERESVMNMKYENEKRLFIHRLEKVTRTWIRQIQEALIILPNLIQKPYDIISEFEFWKSRCMFKDNFFF
jgi:hypothetical protein